MLQVPSDLAIVMAMLQQERKERVDVAVSPSTFADDVAAIHGAPPTLSALTPCCTLPTNRGLHYIQEQLGKVLLAVGMRMSASAGQVPPSCGVLKVTLVERCGALCRSRDLFDRVSAPQKGVKVQTMLPHCMREASIRDHA